MNWSNPESVDLGNRIVNIRNKCDYRIVLDTIEILNDDELLWFHQIEAAFACFYEDEILPEESPKAYEEMMLIIGGGEGQNKISPNAPKLVDWQKDFHIIAPPVSRVLGYDVRSPHILTHWYAFTGAFMEIGSECFFRSVVDIRRKLAEGVPLEKHEREFLNKNQSAIILDSDFDLDDELFLKGG